LLEKASRASINLLSDHVPMLGAGAAPRIPQDHSGATSVPQRKPEDGGINWEQLAAAPAYNWVRAQTRPYPGAFTFLGEEKVTIWQAAPVATSVAQDFPPGTIVLDEADGLTVICADGNSLQIKEVGLAENPKMTAEEFAASRELKTGMKFEFQPQDCGAVVHG
jgi:methionyl-tRNA formyltransferase